MQQDIIRGSFSYLAASVLLYMSAEYAERFVYTRRIELLAVVVSTAILAIMEAWKVGRRVERLCGLR